MNHAHNKDMKVIVTISVPGNKIDVKSKSITSNKLPETFNNN